MPGVWFMMTAILSLGAPDETALPKPAQVKVTVQRIKPSLVTIRIAGDPVKPGEVARGHTVLGAIVSAQGVVIAPHLEVPERVNLEGILWDKSTAPAKRLSTDAKLGVDLFQLRTDKPLAPLAFQESDQLELGDLAMTITSIGDGQLSVIQGILWAKSRDFVKKENALNFDCSIGPGAPHALVFDGAGRVAGITVQGHEMRNNGLAHPGEMLKGLIEKEQTKPAP
jgi:S1-C subfamily serine protease